MKEENNIIRMNSKACSIRLTIYHLYAMVYLFLRLFPFFEFQGRPVNARLEPFYRRFYWLGRRPFCKLDAPYEIHEAYTGLPVARV